MIWDKVKLKKLLAQPIKNGYSPICPGTPNGRWVLGLGALNGPGLDVSQAKPAPLNDSRVNDFILTPGDFLISRSNTLDKVGRVALFKGQLENCSYPDLMMRFRVDSSHIYPEFLEIYLRGSEAIRHFQRSASGTSGSMVKINKSVVENCQVPLPPLSEQAAIADLLSTWDVATETTESLIKAKRQFLGALYQRFFQPNRVSSKNWKRFRTGQFLSPRNEKSIPTENIHLYSLTIEDGITAKTDRYDREFLVKDLNSKTYKVVFPGDIVFNPANLRWGAIARSEVKQKVLVSPIYEVLSVNEDAVNSDLVTHALTCPRQVGIFATKTEGTLIERMAVKLDAFLLTDVVLPIDRGEQDRVAMLLNIAKQEIRLLKRQVKAYRKQKRGLMQKLLTGEWRVRISPKGV